MPVIGRNKPLHSILQGVAISPVSIFLWAFTAVMGRGGEDLASWTLLSLCDDRWDGYGHPYHHLMVTRRRSRDRFPRGACVPLPGLPAGERNSRDRDREGPFISTTSLPISIRNMPVHLPSVATAPPHKDIVV